MLTVIILMKFVTYFSEAVPVEFVADFFWSKNISTVVLSLCSDRDHYQWLRYSSERSDIGFLTLKGQITDSVFEKENGTFNELRIHHSYIQLGLLLQLDCAKSEELLKAVPRRLFSTSQYHWLIIDTAENATTFDLGRYDVPLTLESDFTVATQHENNSILLTDVFKFDRNGKINTTLAGLWTKESGLRWFWTQTRRDRRLNMHNLEITGVIVLQKMYNKTSIQDSDLWRNQDYMRGQDGLQRHSHELWFHLSQLHNFTINIGAIMSSYGAANGSTFNGLFGVLQRQEADVSLVDAVQTRVRMAAVDYVRVLKGFWGVRPMFVFLHPKPDSKLTLIAPVSTGVWEGMAVVAILLSLILSISNVPGNRLERFTYCIIFLAATLAQQGHDSLSRKRELSIRIVVISALFFGFILIFFYTTNILTFLLSAPPKTIRTLRQLIDSSLEIGSENAIQYMDLLIRLDVANAREVYAKKFKSHESFMPFEVGLGRIRKDHYGFMSDDQRIFRFIEENFTDTEKCAVQFIYLLPPNFPFTMPIQKDSPFGEFVARGFLLLLERGIVSRLEHKWMYTEPVCIASDFMPVDLDDVTFAYLLILAGILTSAVFFLLEVISVRDFRRAITHGPLRK